MSGLLERAIIRWILLWIVGGLFVFSLWGRMKDSVFVVVGVRMLMW